LRANLKNTSRFVCLRVLSLPELKEGCAGGTWVVVKGVAAA